MVSTAAGLARHGFLPVVNSFASFLASRANEQIYNQASEGSKVVYALHYAGLIPAGPGEVAPEPARRLAPRRAAEHDDRAAGELRGDARAAALGGRGGGGRTSRSGSRSARRRAESSCRPDTSPRSAGERCCATVRTPCCSPTARCCSTRRWSPPSFSPARASTSGSSTCPGSTASTRTGSRWRSLRTEHVLVLEDHAPVGALGDALRRVLGDSRGHGLRRGGLAGVRNARGGASLPPARRRLARRAHRSTARRSHMKRTWLVLPDQLSIRMFFDAGIVDRLRERLGGRLAAVFLVSREEAAEWSARLGDTPVLFGDELAADAGTWRAGQARRVARPADRLPPARDPAQPPARLPPGAHGSPGHPNWMLDSDREGPLPRWRFARARDAAVALQRAQARASQAPRDDASASARRSSSRTSSRGTPFRFSSPPGGSGCPWSPTWRAGITRSGKGSSRRTATCTSSRTGSWRTTCAAITTSAPSGSG